MPSVPDAGTDRTNATFQNAGEGPSHPQNSGTELIVCALIGAVPSRADEQIKGVVRLPSGNLVQLESMGFVRASNGWAVSFSYVSSVDLQNVEAVRSEATELFRLHLKKVADTTDPKIKAAVLYAYNEPEIADGRLHARARFGTLFIRHAEGVWTIFQPMEE